MKVREILKLYNFKQMKKEKFLLSFTALSIFIAVVLSLIVPQIAESNKRYLENNISLLNGGDLKINIQYPSKAFNEEIKKLIGDGYEVKSLDSIQGFVVVNNGKKTVGRIIAYDRAYNENDKGEYNLKDNEVVLYNKMAKNLEVNIGDKILINDSEKGKKEYTIKAIEKLPSGVDGDAEILGYAKLIRNDSEKSKSLITSSGFVIINGKDIDKIKEKLQSVEKGYDYSTIADKKEGVASQISKQVAILSVITTLAYILSALGIISTTIMLLIKRKRDIGVLKILNIPAKTIKRSMMVELGIVIGIPLILGTIISPYISSMFLKIGDIYELCTFREKLPIVLRGFLFNILMFFVILNLALIVLDGIKPLSIIREDEGAMKKYMKKASKLSIIMIPIMVFMYSIFIGKISSIFGSIGIMIFILIFFVFIFISLKSLQRIHFKNSLYVYSIKAIKKNFSSFILVILSITLTLVFILIGFNMENSIKDMFNKSVSEKLNYNYMLSPQEEEDVESILKNNKNIDGYSKLYRFDGKILNNDIKERAADLAEVKQEDYGVKFKIVKGEDLYEGNKKGCLISESFSNGNKLKVGDILNIETEKGNIDIEIKGIYEGGKVNSKQIICPFTGKSEHIFYQVKSKNDVWTKEIKKSYVIYMGFLGESLANMIADFLKLFKGLCFVSIFSSLLFNINMGFMNYMTEEKDETIIRALGIGRRFNIKYEKIKLSIVVLISILMATIIYSLITNLISKAFLGVTASISCTFILLIALIAFILSLISFIFPINKLMNNKSYSILREE